MSQSAAWSTCPRSAAHLADPTKCKQAPCDVTLHPSGPVGCGCLWGCPLLWRSPAGEISISILYPAPKGPEFNSKAGRLGHFSVEIGGSPRDCVEYSPKYVRITDDSKLAIMWAWTFVCLFVLWTATRSFNPLQHFKLITPWQKQRCTNKSATQREKKMLQHLRNLNLSLSSLSATPPCYLSIGGWDKNQYIAWGQNDSNKPNKGTMRWS